MIRTFPDEFREIDHCGGKFSIHIASVDGRRQYSIGVRHSSPNPAALFGVYALPQGIAVGTIEMGGIGTPWNPSPHPSCIPVMIASDSEGQFGHECQNCTGYWRSGGGGRWPITCPYCGARAGAHMFLTQGQRVYLEAFCQLFEEALASNKDGEFVLDMDAIADQIQKGADKPKFYYAETTQQNKFNCAACNSYNDILGKFGYCATCGSRNDFQEFQATIEQIRSQAETNSAFENHLKDSVAAFDALARQLTNQLIQRVPLRPRRKTLLEGVPFHNLKARADDLNVVFNIDLFDGMKQQEVNSILRFFHRRHVYEHNGGEVDQKYIDDSGDTSVKVKQMLRETKPSAFQAMELIGKLARNFLFGFHEIFPPVAEPIEFHQKHLSQMRERK